jgi:hypothetical protein
VPSASGDPWLEELDRRLERWEELAVAEWAASAPSPSHRALAEGAAAFLRGEWASAADKTTGATSGSFEGSTRAAVLLDTIGTWSLVFQRLCSVSASRELTLWSHCHRQVWVQRVASHIVKAVESMGTRIPGPPWSGLHVVFLESYTELAQITGIPEAKLVSGGTLGVTSMGRIFLLSPGVFPNGYAWFRVLTHELVHRRLKVFGAHLGPPFLEEGLATYLEDWAGTGAPRELTSFDRGILQLAVERREMPGSTELEAPFWQISDPFRSRLAYLVGFLWIREALRRGGDDSLGWLLGELAEGRPLKESLLALSKWNMSRWDARVRQVVKSEARRENVVLVALAFGEDYLRSKQVRSIEESRSRVTLADLLWGRGHHEAALSILMGQPEWLHRSPDLAWRLASLMALTKRLDAARNLVHGALEVFPDDPRLLVALARILGVLGEPEAAAGTAFRAWMVQPFAAECQSLMLEMNPESTEDRRNL